MRPFSPYGHKPGCISWPLVFAGAIELSGAVSCAASGPELLLAGAGPPPAPNRLPSAAAQVAGGGQCRQGTLSPGQPRASIVVDTQREEEMKLGGCEPPLPDQHRALPGGHSLTVQAPDHRVVQLSQTTAT